MTHRYPYRLREAFFASIHLDRPEEIENNDGSLAIKIQVGIDDSNYPDTLQVGLTVTSEDDEPVRLSALLVGLFDAIESTHPPADPTDFIPDFLNERALFLLWPYLVQTVKQLTTIMGMRPIALQTPFRFDLQETTAGD